VTGDSRPVNVSAILAKHGEVEESLRAVVDDFPDWLAIQQGDQNWEDSFFAQKGDVVLHAREVIEHLGHEHGGFEIVDDIQPLAALETEANGRLRIAPGHAVGDILETNECETQRQKEGT
jgi:hypothetical protein